MAGPFAALPGAPGFAPPGGTSREAGATDNALSLSIPYDAEPASLHRATQRCLRLLEACPSLGVSSVRALLFLAQKAAELGLTLGVENHWGLSGRQDQLLYTTHRLREYGVGVCLDLDNFYCDQDALAGVSALAPQVVHVHYKSHAREAEAEATRLDYRTRLGCLQRAGYAGMFSVEYDGKPPGLSGSTRAARVLREMWEGRLDGGC